MPVQHITIDKFISKYVIEIDTSLKIKDLRDKLMSCGFICDDTDKEKWRFVVLSAKDTVVYSDVIYPSAIEFAVPITLFLDSSDTVRVINVEKEKPDLLGVQTAWFTDRQLDCQITLNETVEQNKLKPLMLEHVVSANQGISADYNNVVVCEKETAIKFIVNVSGHDGFAFSIKPDKGDYICESLYVTESSSSSLDRYQDKPNVIVIDSTEALNISLSAAVKYQRITVKIWRLDSLKTNGQLITVNHQVNHRTKRDIKVVDGGSIQAATTRMGRVSTSTFGGASDVIDNPDVILGQVLIHFFIFNSYEDAEKIIGSKRLPFYKGSS